MAVEHVNALTQRWLARLGPESSVVSGLGVWPLLAYLADAADEPGRAELAGALGMSADEAASAARAVVDLVTEMPSAGMALGLWTRAGLPMEPAWLAKVPLGTHGELTDDAAADQKKLDAWASEHTQGLVPRFPARIDDEILLTIASALSVQTEWEREFQPHRSPGPAEGPWAGRAQMMGRVSGDLAGTAVATTPLGPVTTTTVAGDGGIDVHLVLGPESAAAGDVLAAGVDVVGRRLPLVTADQLPEGTPGPGLEILTVERKTPGDILSLFTPAFRIESAHDLLDHPEVFGLLSVTDARRGRFPGMSPFPLAVRQARQNAVAEFGAKGFKAAAVTAMAMMGAGMARPTAKFRVRQAVVRFERPFAYYAVHQASGLILVAGWVAEPLPFVAPQRQFVAP